MRIPIKRSVSTTSNRKCLMSEGETLSLHFFKRLFEYSRSSSLYADYPCSLYDDYPSLSIVKLPLHYDLRELCPVQRR